MNQDHFCVQPFKSVMALTFFNKGTLTEAIALLGSAKCWQNVQIGWPEGTNT